MEITQDFLQAEIAKFERQRDHAHEVAVASQAAVDVLKALVERLNLPPPTELKFSDLGLEDPIPIESIKN
jgi:hypothetical protein